VQLVPLGRRCLAKAIDVTLILAPIVIQLVLLFSQMDSESLYSGYFDLTQSYHQNRDDYAHLFPALFWAVFVFLITVRFEGRFGTTLGKWLCGIRALRTTLRPCGFARALLRELLMWFDTPLLLTVLPGILCCLGTDRRQRIGDLVADTIVVDDNAAESV
jgi:uncharacterized RDD family membrane protein YckC